MKKSLFGLGLIAVVSLVAVVSLLPSSNSEFLGGGNIPDRCVTFDQTASRSIKDTVKASAGKVYLVRADSFESPARYFQFHNQATNPNTGSTPEWTFVIPGRASSSAPGTFAQRFDPPIDFSTGVAFAISSAYATFASTSMTASNFAVAICYY